MACMHAAKCIPCAAHHLCCCVCRRCHAAQAAPGGQGGSRGGCLLPARRRVDQCALVKAGSPGSYVQRCRGTQRCAALQGGVRKGAASLGSRVGSAGTWRDRCGAQDRASSSPVQSKGNGRNTGRGVKYTFVWMVHTVPPGGAHRGASPAACCDGCRCTMWRVAPRRWCASCFQAGVVGCYSC